MFVEIAGRKLSFVAKTIKQNDAFLPLAINNDNNESPLVTKTNVIGCLISSSFIVNYAAIDVSGPNLKIAN